MKDNKVYQSIITNFNNKVKMFGVLIDPDKQNVRELLETVKICNESDVDYFFVGGSIITQGDMQKTTRLIKENSTKPIIIFPGNPDQISNYADAILFLSLING
jgi:heptaprenylglyceryl phosphate synthase